MKTNESEILTRKELPLFIKFAVPNILSLVLISSAGVVDAFFIGNYVSELSLAAVNIANPLLSFIWALTMMIIIGGAVSSSKYIGEKNIPKACDIYTKSLLVITIISIIISVITYIFAYDIIYIMAKSEKTIDLSVLYIRSLIPFIIFSIIGYALSVFARVDGSPFIASFALITGAFINIILDYIFIGVYGYGVEGAAYATGISYSAGFIILLFHFCRKKGVLRISLQNKNFAEIIKTSYNGLSEFLNEISVGISMALFNYIMMKYAQEEGVAAFSAINYMMWICNMINYGAADTLNPLISTNYGAGYFKRIKKLLNIGLIYTSINGIIIFIILTFYNKEITHLFITDVSSNTFAMAINFMNFVKWAFFFSGANMVYSVFFTAMHRPKESAIIASLRALILPVILIIYLPQFLGLNGIYITLPLSEAATFITALLLFIITKKYLLHRS